MSGVPIGVGQTRDAPGRHRRLAPLSALALLVAAAACAGGEAEAHTALSELDAGDGSRPLWAWPSWDSDRFIAMGQSTYVWSRKFGFEAPYTGPQSLIPSPESSYSLSFTAYLGVRLWEGAELYANPEAFQAQPLSHLYGLAGVQSGELQKASGPEIRAYAARLFLRQSFALGGVPVDVPAGLNQLARQYEPRRLVFTVGKVSVTDLFERSTYANDPRTQFMNWALFTYGAYDFTADARGYTIGAAAELYWDSWAIRLGRFMEPTVANGRSLYYNLFQRHGDQIEVEHDHEMGGQRGAVRMLVYRNLADAGRYSTADAVASQAGTIPDITSVRGLNQKIGLGISVEQALTPAVGVWARALDTFNSVEQYAFTEIDNSLSAGVSVKGSLWRRPDDTVGAAFSSNGLDGGHRDYLAAGGLGGFLGDGRLNYGRELDAEAYCSVLAFRGVHLTFDYQLIGNPAYNVDRRGPVHILSGRVHVEF
jgi:high affinity Mn2+ porin